MATPQETSRDVMSKVNSVIAALDSYPELSSTNTQSSFSMSANPIGLFVDFFRLTKGYDWLINTISKFISYGLPALELAVKGVLLSNIKNMLSCSVNPIITENMINNGIVFDINQIDLLNIFSFSPLDKRTDNLGRYYYFGCDPKDGIETIDDVKKSRDFNAVKRVQRFTQINPNQSTTNNIDSTRIKNQYEIQTSQPASTFVSGRELNQTSLVDAKDLNQLPVRTKNYNFGRVQNTDESNIIEYQPLNKAALNSRINAREISSVGKKDNQRYKSYYSRQQIHCHNRS